MRIPNRIYSDIDMSFAETSTGDIAKKFDVNSVKQALKNLIFTRKGERPFFPEYGTDIPYILFEPIDDFTAEVLKDALLNAIRNFEPRVRVTALEIVPLPDQNSYQMTMEFYVVGIFSPATFSITLYRLR